MVLHTISLYEAGFSNGNVSLAEVFKCNFIEGHKDVDLDKLADLICHGCWSKEEINIAKYYKTLTSAMISEIDDIKRDPKRAKQFSRTFSRFIGTDATLETIRKDLIDHSKESFSQNTFYAYFNTFKKLGVIENVPAWIPNLTSKGVIRLSDTHYFSDPAIATTALGLKPKDLIWDLKTLFALFKNFCIRDLKIYARELEGKVYHFKDSYRLECDAVIQLNNGDYGLIQIVLGGTDHFQEAAKKLLKLSTKINLDRMKAPSFFNGDMWR